MLQKQQQQQQQLQLQQQLQQQKGVPDASLRGSVIQIDDSCSDDACIHTISDDSDADDGGGKGVAACDELLDHGKSMRSCPLPHHVPAFGAVTTRLLQALWMTSNFVSELWVGAGRG
jgi:hypothetical protein